MIDVLECIRVALAESATTEQKQAGAAACCAVFAQLSPPPGVPISVTQAPQTRVNLDQVLDLAISKLRSMLPPDASVTTESVRFPFLGGKP
jgi:hypothetical protein